MALPHALGPHGKSGDESHPPSRCECGQVLGGTREREQKPWLITVPQDRGKSNARKGVVSFAWTQCKKWPLNMVGNTTDIWVYTTFSGKATLLLWVLIKGLLDLAPLRWYCTCFCHLPSSQGSLHACMPTCSSLTSACQRGHRLWLSLVCGLSLHLSLPSCLWGPQTLSLRASGARHSVGSTRNPLVDN